MLPGILISVLVCTTANQPSLQAIVEQALAARDGLGKNYYLKMSITRVEGESGREVSTVEVWSKGALARNDHF